MIIRLTSYLWQILLAITVFTSSNIAVGSNQDFFRERYRGWLWFEEQQRAELLEQQRQEASQKEQQTQNYAKAKAEILQFAKELEDLRYMMIRYPENIEHVWVYKKKEAEMLEAALKLDHSYRMVNFIHPEYVNLLKNPTNLYGRRLKEELKRENEVKQIKELAGRVELFLFFSAKCSYCQQLEPVLAEFANRYGFKVEAVSIDGSQSGYFKTHVDQQQSKHLIKRLGLQQIPTIMAVTNDSSISFELMRGSAAITELEEHSVLALLHLNNLQQQVAKQEANYAN